MIYGSTKTVTEVLSLCFIKKNGIISLRPLNPDAMYYKYEVCGNFYGIDNLSDFSFENHVFLKDYICPQSEAEIEEDYELE